MVKIVYLYLIYLGQMMDSDSDDIEAPNIL